MDARHLTAAELTDLRKRAVAAVQAGESPETVARVMDVSRSALYGWLALYRDVGWENLTAQKRGGRPSKLDHAQLQWLYETVTQNQPDQLGLPYAQWTLKALRALIWERLEIELSISTVHRLIRQLNLPSQRYF
jgi:transposase